MESVISLSGTVLTINADANVSWSCKVDGNIFLSKYQGIGSDKINIYYSSTSPFAVIYFLPHNECLAMSQIIEFPLNGEDLNGFYVSPSSMSMKSGNEYIAEANSQYGISLSADTDSIVLSKTSLDKGYNTFIVSGINTNIDGYVIATEKNTNIKAYIHTNNINELKKINPQILEIKFTASVSKKFKSFYLDSLDAYSAYRSAKYGNPRKYNSYYSISGQKIPIE